MPDASPQSSATLLLVEDHLDTAKMMQLILERQGYVVRIAGSVASALEAAHAEKIAVCIADLRLPDGDGKALCRELFARHNVPCICLSGDVSRTDLDPDPDGCFVAYLTKPLDLAQMLEAIQKVLSANSR